LTQTSSHQQPPETSPDYDSLHRVEHRLTGKAPPDIGVVDVMRIFPRGLNILPYAILPDAFVPLSEVFGMKGV